MAGALHGVSAELWLNAPLCVHAQPSGIVPALVRFPDECQFPLMCLGGVCMLCELTALVS